MELISEEGKVDPKLLLYTARCANVSRIFNLQNEIQLHVLDQAGIRYWEKGGKLTQVQFVLIKNDIDEKDIKIPETVFQDRISVNGEELNKPITIEELKLIDGVKIVKDDDSLQYGLNIYYLYLNKAKYSLWLDKKDEYVCSISYTLS